MPSLLVAGLLSGTQAYAMHCGSKIIKKGDLQSKVLKYCGDPTEVVKRYAHRNNSFASLDSRNTPSGNIKSRQTIYLEGFKEEVLIEEWTYNRGKRKLIRVVYFEGGRVTRIDNKGYGD